MTTSITALWLALLVNSSGTPAEAPGCAASSPAVKPSPWTVVGEAERLRNAGKRDQALAALERLQASCALDRRCEATVLVGRAMDLGSTGKPTEGLEIVERARKVFDQLSDQRGSGQARLWRGFLLRLVGRAEEALEELTAARSRLREAGDRAGEARALSNLGLTWAETGSRRKALEAYEEALAIFREIGDETGEAKVLMNTGLAWTDLDDQHQALSYYERALAVFQRTGDQGNEAYTRCNIGISLMALGKRFQAVEAYRYAIVLFKAVGNRKGESAALMGLGNVWSELDERGRALETYRQALELQREVLDRPGEAATRVNIAEILVRSGKKQEALEHFELAEQIFKDTEHRAEEAVAINDQGAVWFAMGEMQRSETCFQRALAMLREVGDREHEVETLSNLAELDRNLGRETSAQSRFEEALLIARATGIRRAEAETLQRLANLLSKSAPARAIFHGKQAVNLYQTLRADAQGIGRDAERTYSTSISGTYRLLADLLVDQGRLAEAQEVLDLLKDDEVRRLLRRGQPSRSRVGYTKPEGMMEAKYQELAKDLEAMEEEVSQLHAVSMRQPQQDARLVELEGRITSRREALAAWFAGLASGLARGERLRQRGSNDFAGVKEPLKAYAGKAVAIYTIVREDGVGLVVYSGQSGKDEDPRDLKANYNIDAKELYRRIFAFRRELGELGPRTKETSAALWEVLIGPIEKILQRFKPSILLWSLDGPLRYVPVAALWDPRAQTWLASKYAIGVITTGSLNRLGQGPRRNGPALGLGVSKVPPGSRGNDGLEDLRWVDAEMSAVIRRRESPGGALPGVVFADERFTLSALRAELRKRHRVVHIASHYVFKPAGDDEGSFLLMGDGTHLTLKEIDVEWPVGSFEDVDLMTLSACDTGMAADARELDGAEVDGLAIVAQQKGAAAVMATLWPVNDPGTAAFMGEFYRRRQAGLTKVEALRQAQLAMASGRVTVSGATERLGRGLVHEPALGSADWSHPYYWAPFILIGNAR